MIEGIYDGIFGESIFTADDIPTNGLPRNIRSV